MDEAPEPEKGRADRPLLRSLLRTEILVTLPTLVISLALAYFSFVQADASRKMQRTETWPYVSYGTDNSSPEVKDEISFSLSNDGVGPLGYRKWNSFMTASQSAILPNSS